MLKDGRNLFAALKEAPGVRVADLMPSDAAIINEMQDAGSYFELNGETAEMNDKIEEFVPFTFELKNGNASVEVVVTIDSPNSSYTKENSENFGTENIRILWQPQYE